MNNWKTVRLGDITKKIGSGATPTGGANNYKDCGISLIRSQNVLDLSFSKDGLAYIDEGQAKKLNNVIVEQGDILLNITGDSVARSCRVPENILPARVNQHVAIIRGDEGQLSNDFLLYYLQHIKTYLLSISGIGGTRNALTKKMIEDIMLNLLPIEEQQRIAGILGALDDKIECNNRINRNLEEQAAVLFRRWFVDFEFPDSNGNPYRSSGGSFIDSPLGEIPTGWKVGKLSDYASHISRGIAPKYADSGEEIILNQKCIRNHDVSFTESRLHTPKAINEKWLKFGDILINSTGQGTLGRVAQFFLNRNNVTVDSHVSIVRPVSSDYIYFLGQAIISREQEIESMASGSTGQTELPRERLNNMEIIIPDLVALTKFNSITSPYFTLKTQKRDENRILKDLRDTLLPKLMNNEIKTEQTI